MSILKNFLDFAGLSAYDNKIKQIINSKVAKIKMNNNTLTPDSSGEINLGNIATTNKASDSADGLMSKEDYTRLKNVAAGAEVNVQSDWNQTTTTADDYIKNKPTLGTASAKDVPSTGNASTTQVVMGSDTRLSDSRNAKDVSAWAKASTKPSYTATEVGAVATTADQGLTDTQKSNARANIGAGTSNFSGSYNDLSNKPTIPTVDSTLSTTSTNAIQNKAVTTELNKKANLSSLATVATSGSYNDLSNKPTIPTIPNGFANIKVDTTTVAADTTTDTVELAGSNVTLTPDATNDKITIGLTSSNVTNALGYTPYDSTNPNGYTNNVGTITGIKMNGSSKGTSGVVDLGTVITDVSGKVDKETGKGLSTNDYTTAEKNKLAGIASGAEVNQNAFSTVGVKVGTTTTNVSADSKTDTVTLIQGSNVTLTPDADNDTITISASQPTVNNGTLTIQKNGSQVATFSANQSGNATANITVPTTAADVSAIASSLKGAANGVAELDSNGKVPTSQLPSYVDDVLEYTNKSSFPTTGEAGKIYVDTSTNLTYRWSGTAYVEISPSLALGETSSTAYRGDRGKIAYDHSQSAHAPSNAQANQNAFSNVAVGSTTIAADTTTDTLTLVGSNVTLTPDATNDKVTIGITKDNVTAALGYTPPTSDTDTTYTFASGTNGFTVTPSNGTAQTVNVTPNDTTKLPLAGGTLTGAVEFANGPMPLSAGKITGLSAGASRVYGDGIAISNPNTFYDVGFIRVLGTGEFDTVLEIATGDDGGDPSSGGETIAVRQYNTSNQIAKEAKLLDPYGNTTFPGTVTTQSVQVGGTAATIQYNSTNQCVEFVFA